MREFWALPAENMLTFNGPEWLLLLMDRLDRVVAAQLLLILWGHGLCVTN